MKRLSAPFFLGTLAPLFLGALALAASPARADKPRCRLERLDPALLKDDKLRLYAGVIELEGQFVEGMTPGQFTLLIDRKPAGKAEKVQAFSSVKEEVDVALVVEVAAQYKKALENVKEALREFLDDQPASMKVSLITFGSDFGKVAPKFIGAPMMSGQLDDLSPDDDSADVRMADAIRFALGELKKLEPSEPGKVPPRRVIVLVSDGLNAKMDRLTFKKLGDDAARAGVPIHTIAYSPIDERGPLLNLGELSKRSNGTFRWAKNATDLKEQLDTLGDEIRKQYVITFPVDLSTTEKHSFGLVCGALRSNVLGGRGQFGSVVVATAGMAWYWWVLILLGAALALLFALGLFLQWREKRKGQPALPGGPKQPKPAKIKPAVPGKATGPQPIAARAPVQAASVRGGTLMAVTGGLYGQRFPLPMNAPFTIGKGPGHALTIGDDPSVSTHHCELRFDGAGFVLRDLGSTNGTFLNGHRLAAPQRLSDGDLVRCGVNTQFKLRID
ncbi:MAG: FHA domain-containing protein [Myxococcales bacterium]|nr:FHA domain-containing protein [Myxococcales bacterium]